MPSPSDEVLRASLESFGRLSIDSLSLDPTSVGLRPVFADALGVEDFRQTNFSKSCSSLLSRTPMCVEQVLLWSTRLGPVTWAGLVSGVLDVSWTFGRLPVHMYQHLLSMS
jgi:hypothetical protein